MLGQKKINQSAISEYSKNLRTQGSYMGVLTVLRAIVLVLIIMNEAISACRFLKVNSSYMGVSTVLGATVLVLINEE